MTNPERELEQRRGMGRRGRGGPATADATRAGSETLRPGTAPYRAAAARRDSESGPGDARRQTADSDSVRAGGRFPAAVSPRRPTLPSRIPLCPSLLRSPPPPPAVPRPPHRRDKREGGRGGEKERLGESIGAAAAAAWEGGRHDTIK